MERLVAPMDFNLPFSRARWVADTGMILASPAPPMATVSVPTKPSRMRKRHPNGVMMRRISLNTANYMARSSLGE